MGQYYKPCILQKKEDGTFETKEWMYSHDYDSGLKLMEHSWIGNNFVGIIETMLIKDAPWYKQSLVWAGDYADGEPELKDDEGREINLYSMCTDDNKIRPNNKILSEALQNSDYKYLVNHDKKEFVDKSKVPGGNSDSWQIHPLSLLTCEGNGHGCGDYRGKDKNNLIGSWSRNKISVEKEIPKDFKEIVFDLIEK